MYQIEFSDAENVGYIIPTPIIDHFLGDIERFGEYRGFCFIGIAYQSLLDTKSIHRFFGLPEDKTGILVTNVFDYSVTQGIVKKHDIITHIDGNQIMNDGTTKFRENETIAMEHLIAMKYDNDCIDITVWRNNQEIQLKDIKLCISSDGKNKGSHLVPIHQYDQQSSYYIFGGCIFTILTQPFLHTWGDDWYMTAPRDLVTEAMKGHLPCNNNDIIDKQHEDNDTNKPHGIQELIVMSSVRPHYTNMGCAKFCNIILEKVGDTKIKSLKHLKQVIENQYVLNLDKNNLIDFHFRRNALMVLDVKQSLIAENEIMERNRIPYRQSVDLDQFDNTTVQQLFDEINKKQNEMIVEIEQQQNNKDTYSVSQSNQDNKMDDHESVVSDTHDDDRSKLLSDCFEEK